jgi:pimeloyl-ACP methyl ester carboxylesterase
LNTFQIQILYLHAFPFDEGMWSYEGQPRLYGRGASIDEWARQLAAENDNPLAVIGASMGGYCAQRMLAHADVRSLVLVGARADADTPERRQARDETIALLRNEGVEALWERQRPALFPEDADERVVARAREIALEQSAEELADAVAAMRDRPDSTDLVRETQARVLVARGEHDPFLSAGEAEALAGIARNGRTHTFAGCGHLPSFERPEEFEQVVLEFLSDV